MIRPRGASLVHRLFAVPPGAPAAPDVAAALAFVDEMLAGRRISTPEHRLLSDALRRGPAAPTDSDEVQA